MATESPLIHDGSQTVSGFDARNSTLSGTTRSGPNGSGQFLAVQLSTTTSRTVNLTTVAGMKIYGILQNKPSTGIAADVGIFGVSKAVAGGTINPGQEVAVSSTAAGSLIAYSSAAGIYPVGRAIESAVVGQIFSVALYGFGGGATGI